MKKNYIYPTVESVKVNAQMHLCDTSPEGGYNVNSTVVNGGNTGADPINDL